MSEDHFKLDVDLDSLRAAQRWLGTIGEHLRAEGPKIGGAPDKIGDAWTGPAADKIKGEMDALGSTVKKFAPDFETARDEVKSFADAVETFQATTLATYNQKWDEANQDASDDIAKAEDKLEGDELGAKRGEIANGLRYTLQAIAYQYGEEKEALVTKAKTLGTALGGLTAVPVPDSVATRFVDGGGSGTRISWTDEEGDFPPDLDANAQLDGLGLSEDSDQQDAGEEAAERLNDGGLTPEEAQELEELMNADSEAFRAAFVNNLDPDKLAAFHTMLSQSGTADNGGAEWGSLLTAISQVLARGSRADNQPTYPVHASQYDDIVEAYTDIDDEFDPDAQTKGYLRLAELVAAGQGVPPTWDSAFLAEVTRKTIAYERDQIENDEYWSWGPAAGELAWLTDKGAEWYGGRIATDSQNPAWGDPLVLYFEAMADDTEAAQGVFTDGGTSLDTELTEYLYDRKAGHGGNYGWALSQVLQSATEPKGSGGPGTPEHVAAELVSSLVGWYADHPLGLNMEEGIVNILTNHVEAVNHAGSGEEGAVISPFADSNFPYQWLTRPNLDDEDLNKLLTNVFGLDYYSNQIAEEKDPPTHEFPLYTQLALAMELSARDEVHHVAQHGEPGDLEILVNDLSQAQQRTLNAFTLALEGEGRDADQRTADSRAALDFVLSIAKEAVPTERLGPAGALTGPGLDKVKGLLVDAIIPQTDYERAASEDASTEDYRQQLTSLKLVKWLEEAGALPDENSPQQWAQEYPDHASFVVDGEFTDPGELYRNREENPDAWNDFLRYYQNSGRSWLAEIDLDEQYTLGWLEEGG